MRRHHAGRAARPGDGREHRHRQSRPPRRRADRADHLRDQPPPILRTWDRFHLALPFGRGVFLWGEPIEIAADLDAAGIEQARLLVETRMNEMAREADRRVGHDTRRCRALGPESAAR